MDPTNHHQLSLLFTGFKRTYDKHYKLAEPQFEQIAMTLPSTTEKERHDWLGEAGDVREWVGDRVIQRIGTHGFEIENKDWEFTQAVKRPILMDDRQGIYTPLFARMGEKVRLHPDKLMFGLIDNGRVGVGYDDVPFFSASHPALINPTPPNHPGVQSNLHSDGDGPYWYLADLSTSIKPLIFQNRMSPEFVSLQSLRDDNVFFRNEFIFGSYARYNGGYGLWQQMFASNRTLNEENLEAAILGMQNLLSDTGEPMAFSPTHLIVPTTLQFAAKRLVSPGIVPSGVAGATITNIHRGALELMVSKRLSRTA